MKHSCTIIILFFIASGILSLVSCDKIFLDVEGAEADLQGKWQMNDADTVYYNFQKSLFQYQVYLEKDSILSVFGYYTLRGDSIDLELLAETRTINNKQTDHSLNFLGWDTLPAPTGQDTLFRSFRLEKLEKKALTLSYQSQNYTFHKF